jgi:hypothetical protein
MDSVFRVLCVDGKVSREAISAFEDKGFRRLAMLAMVVDTRAERRDRLKHEFNSDTATNLGQRILQASSIEALNAAVRRAARGGNEEVRPRATRLPRVLARLDHLAIRFAFETKFFAFEDRLAFSRVLIEWLMKRIEDNDYEAVSHSVVTSVLDTGERRLASSLASCESRRLRRLRCLMGQKYGADGSVPPTSRGCTRVSDLGPLLLPCEAHCLVAAAPGRLSEV